MAIVGSLKDLALQIIQHSPNIPSDADLYCNIESHSFLINFICSNMNLDVSKKQELWNEDHKEPIVLEYLSKEPQMLEPKIRFKAKFVLISINNNYNIFEPTTCTIQEELGEILLIVKLQN